MEIEMKNLMKRFIQEESGATMVEYAILVALVSIAAIAVLLQRSHFERRERIINLDGIDAYLIQHHRQLLDAVVARDADVADRLLMQHFEIGSQFQRRAAAESSRA